MAHDISSPLSCVGLRVIRGEKWTSSKHGGGPGHAGTIVNNLQNHQKFWVQWDNGDQSQVSYPGQNHLTVLDVAQIGVLHSVQCDACRNQIQGFRWNCITCKTVSLCNACYHRDYHEKSHEFRRFDSAIHLGTHVGQRKSSDKMKVKGICKSATVELRSGTGDATTRIGKVRGVYKKLESGLYPGVLVEWRGVSENCVYHLGENGKVDIKYRSPADDGTYYWHHLPAPWELAAGRTETVTDAYTANRPGELTLLPGDTITQVVDLDGQWSAGVVRGVMGRFPTDRHIQIPYDVIAEKNVHEKLYVGESASSEELSSGGSYRESPPGVVAPVIPKHDRIQKSDATPRGISREPRSASNTTLSSSGETWSDQQSSTSGETVGTFTNTEDRGEVAELRTAKKDTKQRKQYNKQVQALFDYTAEARRDLSFHEGDIIVGVTTSADNWWKGNIGGRKGYFPKNFVKIIDLYADSESGDTPKDNIRDSNTLCIDNSMYDVASTEPSSDTRHNQHGNIAGTTEYSAPRHNQHGNIAGTTEDVHRNEQQPNDGEEGPYVNIRPNQVYVNVLPGAMLRDKKKQPRSKTEVPTSNARCVHSYQARTEEELSMAEGDIIRAVLCLEEDWWTGVLHGHSGRFPARYVQNLSKSEKDQLEAQVTHF